MLSKGPLEERPPCWPVATESSSAQQEPQAFKMAQMMESPLCWWSLLLATLCHLCTYLSRLPFMTSIRAPGPGFRCNALYCL